MNILIVAPDYPDNIRSVFPFVKQIVDQFAKMGNRCCVIAPYSITKNKGFYCKYEEQTLPGGEQVVIIRPNYLSFSLLKFGRFSPTVYCRETAIRSSLRHLPFKPDIIYTHFWESARPICHFVKRTGIPLFVATGESEIPDYSDKEKVAFNECVKGVICVSSKNKKESVAKGLTTQEKCIVIPNAINPSLFYQKDKEECRTKLGLPLHAFIVAFCGAFTHRKGVKALSDAIEGVTGDPVFSIFMGKPLEELPSCNNILFKGSVKHDEIVDYLNAADIFVLPTLQEGCCNAIVEAMACGLPIVSSNKDFNWDVLNDKNSVLIEPSSVSQISKAIMMLRDDKVFKEKLSQGALLATRDLVIDKRADKIIKFISERI